VLLFCQASQELQPGFQANPQNQIHNFWKGRHCPAAADGKRATENLALERMPNLHTI
jgi:hypothetical protein